MLTPRRQRNLVSRFQVQNALERRHVTAGTLYYYRCAQFFMNIQKAYKDVLFYANNKIKWISQDLIQAFVKSVLNYENIV